MEHYLNGTHDENADILILVDSAVITDIAIRHMQFAYHDMLRILNNNSVPVQNHPQISIEYDD